MNLRNCRFLLTATLCCFSFSLYADQPFAPGSSISLRNQSVTIKAIDISDGMKMFEVPMKFTGNPSLAEKLWKPMALSNEVTQELNGSKSDYQGFTAYLLCVNCLPPRGVSPLGPKKPSKKPKKGIVGLLDLVPRTSLSLNSDVLTSTQVMQAGGDRGDFLTKVESAVRQLDVVYAKPIGEKNLQIEAMSDNFSLSSDQLDDIASPSYQKKIKELFSPSGL